MSLRDLEDSLAEHGLIPRGGFVPQPADGVPPLSDGRPAAAVLLIGNAGSALWTVFRQSPELGDGAPDPLDRWSARVIGTLAGAVGAEALFPFGGPPWWPFQRWAMRAEPVAPSPLGMLIHPDYGLWHAYRGALLFAANPGGLPHCAERPVPCAACVDKPCLQACPVGAFTVRADGAVGYDTAACRAWLHGSAGQACLDQGCRARRACPVGSAWRYQDAHAAFHMRGFLRWV